MDVDRPMWVQETRRLRQFCLARLIRFALLAARPMPERPAWARLARQATWSAYLDCVELGMEQQARAMLASIAARASAEAPPSAGAPR